MNSAEPTSSEVEQLLKAVGDDVIRAYRDKYFPAGIIQACPTIYSIENAAKWINVDKFLKFVAYTFQQVSPPASPKKNIPNECSDEASPSNPSKRRKLSADTTPVSPANSDHSRPQASSSAGGRRKSTSSTKQSTKLAAGLHQVTRQSWVEIVEVTTETREHWPVPDSGASIAYILDLTNDPKHHTDEKGKKIAMSALIKQKCTDAWTGGTGGSLSKATTVRLLGEDIKCQKMSHDCRGIFVCSRAAPDLWKNYRCEDRDAASEYSLFGPQEDIFESGFDPEHFEKPVIFYNSVVKEQCPFDNSRCPGRLEYKRDDLLVDLIVFGDQTLANSFSQFPLNGRQPYVGCSSATSNETAGGHLFHPIPSDVDHTLLIKLINMDRINLSNTLVFNRPCTFTVAPRTGYKQKVCPHIHVQDGEIYDASMEQRPCPAKITIFAPIDHSLQKAVIIPAPGISHNHPFCPWDKRTRKEKAAARSASVASPEGQARASDASAATESTPTPPQDLMDSPFPGLYP